jgi:hypothetical protein
MEELVTNPNPSFDDEDWLAADIARMRAHFKARREAGRREDAIMSRADWDATGRAEYAQKKQDQLREQLGPDGYQQMLDAQHRARIFREVEARVLSQVQCECNECIRLRLLTPSSLVWPGLVWGAGQSEECTCKAHWPPWGIEKNKLICPACHEADFEIHRIAKEETLKWEAEREAVARKAEAEAAKVEAAVKHDKAIVVLVDILEPSATGMMQQDLFDAAAAQGVSRERCEAILNEDSDFTPIKGPRHSKLWCLSGNIPEGAEIMPKKKPKAAS